MNFDNVFRRIGFYCTLFLIAVFAYILVQAGIDLMWNPRVDLVGKIGGGVVLLFGVCIGGFTFASLVYDVHSSEEDVTPHEIVNEQERQE